MNIFDKSILNILNQLKEKKLVQLDASASLLEKSARNSFLMGRDTAVELGGYPKESINIYVPSSNLDKLKTQIFGDESSLVLDSGIYSIGNPQLLNNNENHISFGKIVLLETQEIPDDKWYDFTQKELLTDSKIYLEDIMLRQSSTHYNLNLRIGKKAAKNGFNLSSLGKTIYNEFAKIDGVKSVSVIFIVGESDLYKNLLPSAERVKEITLTLNHIFDGIDMDCGHCNLVEICNEVEGIRKLHKNRSK